MWATSNPVGCSSPALQTSVLDYFLPHIPTTTGKNYCEACDSSSHCLPDPLVGLSSQCLGSRDTEHRALREPPTGISEADRSESSTSDDRQWPRLMSIAEYRTWYSSTSEHRAAPPCHREGGTPWLVSPNTDGATGRYQPEMTFCSDR